MENTKLLIILLAALARIIPHIPNFTPIAALALFSGANFNKKSGIFIAISAMLISDLILGFHSTMPYVYISFILIVLIGSLLKKYKDFSHILSASFSSSLLFFIITNFGVWASTNLYAKNFSGLIDSYIMGLPFLRNTIIGDLFYTFGLFYGFHLLTLLSQKLRLLKTK